MPITDVAVRNAKAIDGKRVELVDGNGLSMRVSPDGRKAWSVIYRVAGGGKFDEALQRRRAGDKKRANLGYWPEVSLVQARAAAAAVRSQALSGIDPRPAGDVIVTVSSLIDLYCTSSTAKTKHDKKAILVARVQPLWGDRDPKTLARSELPALLADLTPSRQFEVRKHVVAMFNWAADRGFVGVNPFAGMRLRIDMSARERTLSVTEAKMVFVAAERLGYPFGDLYQMLMLSGCRLREVAEAQWQWLDNDMLVIPGANRKTGKAQVVPLPVAAINILKRLPRQAGPFIFSITAGDRPVSGFSKAKKALDNALDGNVSAFVIHDFRRTVRSHLSRLGVDATTAELVLGHQLSGVLGIYDRYERLAERRTALEIWSSELVG